MADFPTRLTIITYQRKKLKILSNLENHLALIDMKKFLFKS
jgi:hypothetical protein